MCGVAQGPASPRKQGVLAERMCVPSAPFGAAVGLGGIPAASAPSPARMGTAPPKRPVAAGAARGQSWVKPVGTGGSDQLGLQVARGNVNPREEQRGLRGELRARCRR
uniref:Uncharacterized protein n=1 Tax=Pavo cristatus TaxID=9049 RepID=A0A8C9FXH8_PAVCR